MGISGWCCFKKRYYSQRAVWFRWFLGKKKRNSNTRVLAVSDHAARQTILMLGNPPPKAKAT